MDMNSKDKETSFSDAVAKAMKIRKLYKTNWRGGITATLDESGRYDWIRS
ncbi:MAG: hypothetical protein WC799_17500 [Desulfobacteraceae bacterium]|jgi:hypothetical protein